MSLMSYTKPYELTISLVSLLVLKLWMWHPHGTTNIGTSRPTKQPAMEPTIVRDEVPENLNVVYTSSPLGNDETLHNMAQAATKREVMPKDRYMGPHYKGKR